MFERVIDGMAARVAPRAAFNLRAGIRILETDYQASVLYLC